MDRRWERIGGLAGIGFVVLAVGGIIAAGSVPKPDSPTAKISLYFVDHRSSILASCYLFAASTVLVIPFVATVVSRVRTREEDRTPMPGVVLLGGAFVVVIATVASLATLTLAYRAGGLGGNVTRALFDISNLANTLIGFGVIVFLGGLMMAAARVPVLPGAWLPATAVVVLGEFVSTFQIFARSGVFAPGGALTYVFFSLFMLWVLGFSVAMLRDATATASNRSAVTPTPHAPAAI